MKQVISSSWSPNLAYAVGLITTDGCLSKDGRHIDLSSNDLEQLLNLIKCLNIKAKISTKKSGLGGTSMRVQFSNVKFYQFLLRIGLCVNKSKILGPLEIPNKFFFDFLRGHFDGDGTFYSYKDKRWKNSNMFYMCFLSASKSHILWIQSKIKELIRIKGSISKARNSSVFQLRYAKQESMEIISRLYYNKGVICLNRKKQKIDNILKTCAGGEMVYTYA